MKRTMFIAALAVISAGQALAQNQQDADAVCAVAGSAPPQQWNRRGKLYPKTIPLAGIRSGAV